MNASRLRAQHRQLGFTVLELLVVVSLVSIIGAMGAPSLGRARRAANEASAIASLRTIASAQGLFAQGDLEGDGAQDLATTLQELDSKALIDPSLVFGPSHGYTVTMRVDPATQLWCAVAVPRYRRTGVREFYVDETGEVHDTDGGATCTGLGTIINPSTTTTTLPPPPPSAKDLGSKDAIAAIGAWNKLGGGALLPGASAILADPANLNTLLHALDTDSDGAIRWGELAGVDLLTLSRNVVGNLNSVPMTPTDAPPISDADVEKIAKNFQSKLLRAPHFDCSELPPTALDTEDVVGDPVALLALVP